MLQKSWVAALLASICLRKTAIECSCQFAFVAARSAAFAPILTFMAWVVMFTQKVWNSGVIWKLEAMIFASLRLVADALASSMTVRVGPTRLTWLTDEGFSRPGIRTVLVSP